MRRLLFILVLLWCWCAAADVPAPNTWPQSSFVIVSVTFPSGQGSRVYTYLPPGTACSAAQNAAGFFDYLTTGTNVAGGAVNFGNACMGGSLQSLWASFANQAGYVVSPAAFTCPGGYSVIGGYCATCPMGQISSQSVCIDPCPVIGGLQAGPTDQTSGKVGLDFAGDWSLYFEKNFSSPGFKYSVAGDSGTSTFCEIGGMLWSYDVPHDTTYVEMSYTGNDGSSSEISIGDLKGTSAHAAPGTGGQGSVAAQPVVVTNQTGASSNPTNVTGNVTATIPGNIMTSASDSPYNVHGASGPTMPGVVNNPIAVTSSQFNPLTAAISNLGGVNGTGTSGSNAPGTGNNPIAVQITGEPSVVVVGGGSGGGSGVTTGTGDGQGGTTCCSGGSVTGFPAWPTAVPTLYTPKYSSWSSVYSGVMSELNSNVGTAWMMTFANLQLTPSGNYNGGYPVVPFTLPQDLWGGATFVLQLNPMFWDIIRALVLLMTGYGVIWLIFRG